MQYSIKYGHQKLALSIPDTCPTDIIQPITVYPLESPLQAFEAALDSPLGHAPLSELPEPASVAIAVPDETRPFPIKQLLPILLDRIFKAFPHLEHHNITIVVGGGLHEPPDQAQLDRILPSDLHGCSVVSHDAHNSSFRRMGVTSRGTPVEINAAYANAELKIVMGMVDAHQFTGFTGGAKGVVVGCASAAMIAHNHSLLTDAQAFAGNLEGNPVREDLNESGVIAGVNLAINVALTAEKKIAALFVGDPLLVLQRAAKETRALYGHKLHKKYDVVVASCGGYPKDICLYQAQKALDAARNCVAPQGKILLVAECSQGIGDEIYENYVSRFTCQQDLLKDFAQHEFKMGAHKAFLFGRVAAAHELVLHTELSEQDASRCLLHKGDAQQTLNDWFDANPQAETVIITYANSTFFYTPEA